MSDTDFVDVGDELVVRISGYPVGKVRVETITDTFSGEKKAVANLRDDDGNTIWTFYLPLDVKDYDTVDGYGHHSQPLESPLDYTEHPGYERH